jgi:hypothetical protein
MSLTYGYDLKDGDKILEAPVQTAELLSPLMLPGATLVNHVPFCAITCLSLPYYQCLTVMFSAAHSFMGPILQLRTIRANS